MGPPPKFEVGGGGSRPGALERTPARAVRALPPLLEEIDWTPKTPKIQVVDGDGAKLDALKRTDGLVKEAVDALKRTDGLVKEAVSSLPPPPGRGIWLDGAQADNEDPVALALKKRGIDPDARYDPYFDLFMYGRPLKEERLRAWLRFPLKLHDAGLVEAERSIITWGSGLSGRRVDFTSEITNILELHPGPIVCLRIDESAFPAPERLRRWADILTAKEIQQLILINLTRPEEVTQAPLHHLRSRRLTYLAIGFINIRACLRLAMEAAKLDGHPWSSLKGLTLTACAFDGPDLSRTISNLPGLKNFSMHSCPLSVACSEDGFHIHSDSLVTLRLWRCTTDHKVTVGPAPALTHLTLGVAPAPKEVADPPPLVEIEITFCSSLNILDQLDMHQQDISFISKSKMKVNFQMVPALPFLHTLAVAVEMATTHHGSVLVWLLSCFPNLKVLTVQRVDDGTSDGVCPGVDSVPCLANSLQHLTIQQFRGGDVEVMFLVHVLDVARFLSTLTVEAHPMPPPKPQDTTSSAQPHPTLRWQDAASHFHRCHRASRHCDIIVVPPTSY
ncbi:unnamed protein product [Urochloa decumbens]|uniref:F-box/LRR-repeat protein 15/At3g58940/PEG3-like LRR domain-containing protein n=1 Tax=Urochloa decumbens TaxID=240449 RepID=A0ABC9H310_9POAL